MTFVSGSLGDADSGDSVPRAGRSSGGVAGGGEERGAFHIIPAGVSLCCFHILFISVGSN